MHKYDHFVASQRFLITTTSSPYWKTTNFLFGTLFSMDIDSSNIDDGADDNTMDDVGWPLLRVNPVQLPCKNFYRRHLESYSSSLTPYTAFHKVYALLPCHPFVIMCPHPQLKLAYSVMHLPCWMYDKIFFALVVDISATRMKLVLVIQSIDDFIDIPSFIPIGHSMMLLPCCGGPMFFIFIFFLDMVVLLTISIPLWTSSLSLEESGSCGISSNAATIGSKLAVWEHKNTQTKVKILSVQILYTLLPSRTICS